MIAADLLSAFPLAPVGALPRRHPAEEELLDLASGQADLTQRLVLEAHLAHCPLCTSTVGEMAAVGGLMMGDVDDSAVAPPSSAVFDRLMERIAAPEPMPDPAIAAALPRAALAELPPGATARWHRIPGSQARFAHLCTDPVNQSYVLFGSLGGGLWFPEHTHVGTENVVILAGGYADQTGDFEPGDYGTYLDGTSHKPLTDDGADCVILTRLEHVPRFRGWRGLLQRVFGPR